MEHLSISHRDPSAVRPVERTHSSRARSGSGRGQRPRVRGALSSTRHEQAQHRAGVSSARRAASRMSWTIRAASGSPGSRTGGTGSNRSSVPAPRAHGRRDRPVLRQPPLLRAPLKLPSKIASWPSRYPEATRERQFGAVWTALQRARPSERAAQTGLARVSAERRVG